VIGCISLIFHAWSISLWLAKMNVKRSLSRRSLVQIVTHDRVPDGAQVHSNLMSPPRQRAHLQHRHFVESFEHAELRDRRLPPRDDPHALAMNGVAPDGAFNPPFVFGDCSVHHR
jgi:hypothetical protein